MPKYPIISLILFLASVPVAASQVKEALNVTTRTFKEVAIYPAQEAPATVVSLGESVLNAEINARIIAIPVQVGDKVKRRHILMRLDCRDYELSFKSAQANLKSIQAKQQLTKLQLDRINQLMADKSASLEELNQKQAEWAVMEAQGEIEQAAVEKAKQQIEKCVIRAPYDGVITARRAQLGELALAGRELLQIVDLSHLEVAAQLPLDFIEDVNQVASLTFMSGAGKFPVKLRVLVPKFDSVSRSQEARFLFEDMASLAAGTPGRLLWTLRLPHIPANLLVRREGKLGVFLVKGGKAHFFTLAGAQEGRPAVAGALSLDTQIIADGRNNLAEGDLIKVVGQ